MKLRIELSRRMQSSLSAWGRLPSLLECLCINHRMRLCKLSEICGIGLLYLWVLHLQTQLTRDRKYLCVGGYISIEHILTSSHCSLMQ